MNNQIAQSVEYPAVESSKGGNGNQAGTKSVQLFLKLLSCSTRKIQQIFTIVKYFFNGAVLISGYFVKLLTKRLKTGMNLYPIRVKQ